MLAVYAVTHGIALYGIEGLMIGVEADVQSGLPGFEMVGLPASSIREAKERVRSALINSGFNWPRGRITVSLSPADWRKEGSGLDLPIAIAILIASEQLPPIPHHTVLLGELALDGTLREFRGLYASVKCAVELGANDLILPVTNEFDLTLGSNSSRMIALRTLFESVQALRGHFITKKTDAPSLFFHVALVAKQNPSSNTQAENHIRDFRDIVGQVLAKRAMFISAIGNHHMLFYGPPGSGKSMLAERLPSILPNISPSEFAELKHIYSIAGLPMTEDTQRPFRSPHHSITVQGLLGGGVHPKPGEITLAHHGVLFLDEFPEFTRQALEGLRQPLETGKITISRSTYAATFPSKFNLIAAMNPCPCGYHGFVSEVHHCRCSLRDIDRYRAKVSGPLLDRIDMTVWITPTPSSEWRNRNISNESSSNVLEKVIRAKQFRTERIALTQNILQGSTVQRTPIERLDSLSFTSPGVDLLIQSADRLHLSSRSLIKIADVSRSIADAELSDQILVHHVAEALQYRAFTTSR